MAAPALEAVLAGEAGPERVRAALRSASTRRPVRRALGGLLAPGGALGPVRLDRVKLKPGRKLSVWGRAAVVDGAGRRSQLPVAVTWVPAGMEVLASPVDPAAPELVDLLDPSAVPDRPVVSTVRYRPRQRHVLRYDGRSGPPCWAKLVPGRDGSLTAGTATVLADGLAGRGHADVLRPLRLLPGGAVLWPHAPGRPLLRLHRTGRPWPADPLHRAAAGLRELHDLDLQALPSGRVADLDGELAGVARAGEHLAALDPPGAQVLDGVLGAVRDLLGGPTELAPGHGDCKLDHLWVDRGTVTFIDVDSAAMADPARDLGKLLADLRWWTTRTGTAGLDAARAALAAGYRAGDVPERWARACVWEGLLLAKAVVRRTSLLDPEWILRTRAELRDAQVLLDARPAGRAPVVAAV